MTDPRDGGTVRYHRADWVAERDRWVVTFPNGRVQGFTAEQGEAMGLTPPEPEPPSPIDTDVAELVELIDRYGAMGVALALLAHDDITNVDDFLDSLLERWMELRDARQDPQPASDTHGSHVEPMDDPYKRQPEQDDTASCIDFDALPIGTVLWDGLDFLLRLPGGWTYNPPADEHDYYDPERHTSLVYQPAPLSPGECLRGLLAGRDDADELWAYAAENWRCHVSDSPARHVQLLGAVGDAARSGGAT